GERAWLRHGIAERGPRAGIEFQHRARLRSDLQLQLVEAARDAVPYRLASRLHAEAGRSVDRHVRSAPEAKRAVAIRVPAAPTKRNDRGRGRRSRLREAQREPRVGGEPLGALERTSGTAGPAGPQLLAREV